MHQRAVPLPSECQSLSSQPLSQCCTPLRTPDPSIRAAPSMPKPVPTPQSPAAPRVPGTEPHLHSTTVGGNGGQETGFPLHLPDSLQCSPSRRLPTSGPARQTTLWPSSPCSFAPFVIFPPLRRHGKGTASGIRNPGSNPGAIMKRTMISEHHFRTCDVEGTMLTPAWQGWLRIKRGG